MLPARLPNLMVNGSSGIAVGMTTNIPPHNLGEVCDAEIYLIEQPDATTEDLMKIVRGPDFPTGGIIIGREGMTGLAIVMGHDRAQHATYIQAAGKGQRISAANLREADERSNTLHRAMLRYAHSFLHQTTTTALANGRSKLEERLARWLLMADDRIDDKELPLTHEFLGIMLGTHRPGVTIAVQALEKAGLITTRRSHITIVDRKRLEKSANGAYVTPEG